MLKKKVTVITLNYNETDYTYNCVKSILESNYSNFELILVDNGSSLENFKLLKNKLPKDDRLLIARLEDNIGYVGGVNYGLKKANETDCDYFLIMNNDTLIDTEAIKELVITSEKHQGKAIVSGKVYNYDENDILQYIGQDFDPKQTLNQKPYVMNRRENDEGQYDREIEMGMLDDIFWMLSKEIYDNVGLYSDFFFLYGEQNDYAFRTIKKGYKLIYTYKAKLWHKGGITVDSGNKWLKSPKVEYWGTMAVLKLCELHLEKHKKNKFRKNFILRTSAKKIFLFLTGQIKYNIVKSHFLAVKHFRFWNEIRYKDNGYNPFN